MTTKEEILVLKGALALLKSDNLTEVKKTLITVRIEDVISSLDSKC